MIGRLVGWLDDRTGSARFLRSAMNKVFPDHWSFLLGEVALFCFLILLLSGTFLTFFYVPSSEPITYEGSLESLQGTQVSAAYASVLDISLEVRAGLLMRQLHHWTALVFVAVVALHMARVFFTGAFRRPRDLNWLVGISLLLLALAAGFTGYSLPDDLLSGTGLRIAYSAALSIPFVGPWLASLVFGGEFPTHEIISRLFVLHIMVLPGLIIGAIGVHVGLTWVQKHTMHKGPGMTEGTVRGPALWPVQAFRSLGLLFLTAAVLALISGWVQINPVWDYGPFLAHVATVPAQPDWYVGWLEGALRLGLPVEFTIAGVTVPSPFIPGVLIPGVLFGVLALWPFIERRVTGDDAEHHLLDRVWEAPGRAAVGAAILTFFLVQTVAGGNDVLSVALVIQIETLTVLLQVLQVVLPLVVGVVVYAACRSRLARERAAPPSTDGSAPGRDGIVIRREPDGGFGDHQDAP